MDTIDKNSNFKLAPHVSYSETESSLIILDAKNGKFFETNHSAKLILSEIEKNNKFHEIESSLSSKYENFSKKDLEDFLAALVKNEFIYVYKE